MLEELKQQVYAANMELPRRGLVTYTWGNVSGIDRKAGLVVIKPSGVAYEELTPDKLVVLALDGRKVEGGLNPSQRHQDSSGAVQGLPAAGRHRAYPLHLRGGLRPGTAGLPPLAHPTPIIFTARCPARRELTPEEIDEDYERNTGKVILETFARRGIDRCMCRRAVRQPRAVYLGQGCRRGRLPRRRVGGGGKMAVLTLTIDPGAQPAPQHVLDKHFMRKHGPNAYYGQKK